MATQYWPCLDRGAWGEPLSWHKSLGHTTQISSVSCDPSTNYSAVEPERPGGPEVPFETVGTWSNIFQTQVVIHRVSEFLFASQVMLGGLNGCMVKQELNLFKFSPGQVAESCAGAP